MNKHEIGSQEQETIYS